MRAPIAFLVGFATVVGGWHAFGRTPPASPVMHPNNLQQLHLTTHSSVAVTEGGAPVTIDPTAAASSVARAAAGRPAAKSRKGASIRLSAIDAQRNTSVSPVAPKAPSAPPPPALAQPLASALAAPVRDSRPVAAAPPPLFQGWYDCVDSGEAYSGAYFSSVEAFLRVPAEEERLHSKNTNMEGASFMQFAKKRKLKSIDMLDFFSVHLSWYERRLGVADAKGGIKKAAQRDMTAHMMRQTAEIQRSGYTNPTRAKPPRVVAVMPFFASSGGALGKSDAGHSAFEMRRAYLNITFWALHDLFGNVVVSVATQHDHDFVRALGLPWYDVLLNTLPRASVLGIATVIYSQRAFAERGWDKDFDYIFYTESDQILHVRDMAPLLAEADANTIVLPHRAVPVPLDVDFSPATLELAQRTPMAKELRTNAAKTHTHLADANALMTTRCCFDRGECTPKRDHWKNYGNNKKGAVSLVGVSNSFAFITGEGNFLRDHYRTCKVQQARDLEPLAPCP